MIKTTLTIERFSPSGDILEKRVQESRSWIKHFFDLLYVYMAYNTTLAGVNDVTSTPRTLGLPYATQHDAAGTLRVASPPGGTEAFVPGKNAAGATIYCYPHLRGEDIGIVVGTGNNPATPSQDALQTKVAHGETAGLLLYGGCEVYGLLIAHPNGQFTVRRYFTNVLGGDITIQEVGIYSPALIDPTVNSICYDFCIARDVVAPGVVVHNAEILRVTYVPAITV